MKHNSLYILVFLLCVNSRVGKTQEIKYDCRLYESEFNELEYIKGTLLETSFTEFTHNVDNGVFFMNRFLGQDKFYKAILLKKENEKTVVNDLLNKEKHVTLPNEAQKNIGEILNNIEKGSFRQACFESPNEGSLSVLIVKVNGAIVLKYEAGDHDYSHLNAAEKIKIKNALEIIKFLVDAIN